MKKVLLAAVIFVNSFHAMQGVKPYDPESSFKKVIRNGIGVAATFGGAYGAFKKFKEGDVTGSLKYGAVACAGLLCFRVPDFLMSAKEKKEHVEVGTLTSILVRAKEERHPDFETFVNDMPKDTNSNHTISAEYAAIVNKKMSKVYYGYRPYMKTKASIGYRIISTIMGFKPWYENTEIDDFYQVKPVGYIDSMQGPSRAATPEEQANILIFYFWAMRYGMPQWNGYTDKNDPQLIADLRALNNWFTTYKKGAAGSLTPTAQLVGDDKKQHILLQNDVDENQAYRLAMKGYPIILDKPTSFLFNPFDGKPLSKPIDEKIVKKLEVLKKILQKLSASEDGLFLLMNLNNELGKRGLNQINLDQVPGWGAIPIDLWSTPILKKFVTSEKYRTQLERGILCALSYDEQTMLNTIDEDNITSNISYDVNGEKFKDPYGNIILGITSKEGLCPGLLEILVDGFSDDPQEEPNSED